MNRKSTNKKLRKLQFDDEALVVLGGKKDKDVKLIVKDLQGNKCEHLTIVVDKNLSFDLHKTEEGKMEDKKHTPLAVARLGMSLPEFRQKLVSLIPELKISARDLASQDFTVVIPKSIEAVKKIRNEFWREDKDRMVFTSKNPEEFLKHYHVVPSSNLPKRHFPLSFLFTKDNFDFVGLLIGTGRDYFLVNIKMMEELIQKQMDVKILEQSRLSERSS